MSLFDLFKKKTETVKEAVSSVERLENPPQMLVAKLLFEEKPNFRPNEILIEARKYFATILHPGEHESPLFTFPDFEIKLADTTIPASCLVTPPGRQNPGVEIPEEAFQQNWHWKEASEAAKKCKYELLVTDFIATQLAYKKRLDVFNGFLVAAIKATNPDLVYSVPGQKLLKPGDLIDRWKKEFLYSICNVRLYNITGTPAKEMLMDTVGLNVIGLADCQIRFSGFEPNKIAQMLWNYAYYIYDKGDIIETGNTLEGLESGSKWKCEREISPMQPERIIINIQPN